VRTPHPPLAILLGIAALVVLALAHRAEIRERAHEGLGRGIPAREAELARGFVLGEDGGIDAETSEAFRRSGLSHLLAVSGENVTLLALLAMPLLAVLGVSLRERLIWVLGLIAVYVPVAGAGPSLQRAGVMGAAGLLATLGGRRGSRLYALALAAAVTLAIDPGVAGDVGWQLSFAAVLGILALAAPLRRATVGRIGGGPWRRALAEGVAVTVAATLATAPLIAYDFETLSTTTLVANLLAMPAVAPAMWLGMLGAAASQLPGVPLEPLNGLEALTLAYIAQVAAWCAAPDWAEIHVHLGVAGLLGVYLALAIGVVAVALLARWRRLAGARSREAATRPAAGPGPGRRCLLVAVAVVALVAVMIVLAAGGGGRRGEPPGLRVEVLDVGQGDAILLEPAGAAPILVDGGPPGDGLAGTLVDSGVTALGAAVLTHDQSDHVGGIEELLGRLPVARVLYGRLDRRLLAEARAAGANPVQIAAGEEVRSGDLHLEVLWPPAELLAEPAPGARIRTSLHSSCSPAGIASGCCLPPTPRPSRSRSTPAGSMSSRSPTTAAPTPASPRSSTGRGLGSR
jgi:competence protein ComEC